MPGTSVWRCASSPTEASLTNEFGPLGIRLSDTLQPTASALLNRLLARGKFRHVQLLLKLAELGSVQRTADALGMTQSSVTQALAYVERLLETPLFHRHARGVRPTPAGTDLLPVARQVMQGVTEAAEVIAARHRQGQGVVRLMASAAAINGLLVNALTNLDTHVPGVEAHLREAEGEDQLLAIARGEVDLVACRQPPVIPEAWQFVPLLDDEVVVVCSAGHALARARSVSPTALAQQLWVLAPAGTMARERYDEFAAGLPEAPRSHPLITRNLALMVRLLQQRQALSMLPRSFVHHLIEDRELAAVKIRDPIPLLPLGLLQPAAAMSEATSRLAGFLTQAAAVRPRSRPVRRP